MSFRVRALWALAIAVPSGLAAVGILALVEGDSACTIRVDSPQVQVKICSEGGQCSLYQCLPDEAGSPGCQFVLQLPGSE